MLNQRLSAYLRHVLFTLRGGFLIRPAIIALALAGLGAGLSAVEELYPASSSWIPTFLFPSNADPQVAQIILSSIATSMMTVVAIVFAILLMTLTLASMQFSPRIITTFVSDLVTQQTLGIYLGTFLYCIAALPAARTIPMPFSPVLTVLGAMILSVACVGWLLFFIHHISMAISVNYIVDRIARETEAMIDGMMPHPRRADAWQEGPPGDPDPREMPVPGVVSGYVRTIDATQLRGIAKAHRLSVRVLRRVGHFVPADVPLLTISKPKALTPGMSVDLRRAFRLGPTRTLEQDIEFGVLQLVDIALKAISPAVNDPSTAINCIDQLSSVLIHFAAREAPRTNFYDPPGVLQVSIPYVGFDRLLESAFEQIRLYARADVAVSLRILRALSDIALTLPDNADRRLLAVHGRQLLRGCSQVLSEDLLAELKSRLASLEKITTSDSSAPLLVLPDS